MAFALERVPKKLSDFFDTNTLHLFEKRAMSWRSGDFTRSESALRRDATELGVHDASLVAVSADHPPVSTEPFGEALRIEQVDLRVMVSHQRAWSDLVGRVLEPNVFLDPAFALPLLQHVRFDARPAFLLVWEGDRLVGLLPVHLPTGRGLPPRLARGFRHKQVTLGTPLLDAVQGASAFAAMLAWLRRQNPGLAGLVLTAVPTEGAFFQALSRVADHPPVLFDKHQRAVSRHAPESLAEAEPVTAILSGRRRKELRRQRRRLADYGTVSYQSARRPADIRRAAEQFLALEGAGWKGRRGTALLADPTLATFTRTMTRLMAHEGRCRIDSLEVDGTPVAMGILIMAGERAHFWKTTFCERFAALSPGVQFALELTRMQAVDRQLALTDSCAVPDHPMIDRIWTERMSVADILVPLGMSRGYERAARAESLRRSLRGTAKRVVQAASRLLSRVRTH